MNVYEILSESVTEQDKDTHCSDKCCGAEVKREDCKCSADCKHCNCNDPKVNEAGIVSKIKDKLGFGKKKAVNKPKLKRNPRIKVAKGAGQVSRASDGNVYVWAGAAWVNNETAKFAPKQVTAELGNPVLIGLANQIKKAGLTDVVKPFLLSV